MWIAKPFTDSQKPTFFQLLLLLVGDYLHWFFLSLFHPRRNDADFARNKDGEQQS